jgi:phage gp46-like protein
LEQAALLDLEVFKTSGIAEEIKVTASIPKLNRLNMLIEVNSARGENSVVEFEINWQTYTQAA